MEPKLWTTIFWRIVFSETTLLATLDRTPCNAAILIFQRKVAGILSILFVLMVISRKFQITELESTLTPNLSEMLVLLIKLYSETMNVQVPSI